MLKEQNSLFMSFSENIVASKLLLLHLLLCCLCLSTFHFFFRYIFDDTNSNCLLHVTNSKTTEWWIARILFDTHILGGLKGDQGSVTTFDCLWKFLCDFSRSLVALIFDLVKLASNMGRVTIQHWRITIVDLTRMIKDNDLDVEKSSIVKHFANCFV